MKLWAKSAALLLALAGITQAQTWENLVDRYFDEAVFRYNPSAATSSGFHNFDGALEDYSQGGGRAADCRSEPI